MKVDGLLSGIRVLDVTTVLAGPFAGYQLSLFGADVVKVEMPGEGDVARTMGDHGGFAALGMGAPFLGQNAGKRSITINLKNDAGREVFARLARDADVLLENMRPGVMDRLGVGYEAMKSLNPRLVYCAVSGFGDSGPLSSRPAYDQIIQGLSGMSDVTGRPDQDPTRIGFPICDTFSGLAAAMAICAALVRRSHSGAGAYLDVSMLEAGITAMGSATSDHLVSGAPAERIGNDNTASSPSGSFHTGEGLLVIAANTQRQFESLCRVIGRTDLIDDVRFIDRKHRKRHRAELSRELESALATRSASEWESRLVEVHVPAGRVLSVAEALVQPQVVVRGLIHDVAIEGSGARPGRVLGSGVHVDGHALAPSSPPPRLGQHTRDVLLETGYSNDEVDQLETVGAL